MDYSLIYKISIPRLKMPYFLQTDVRSKKQCVFSKIHITCSFPTLISLSSKNTIYVLVCFLIECALLLGNARGKGGSMHLYYKNMYGGEGIVGGHGPMGTGIGFAHKYRNNGAVSWTILGDGAVNQGQTHESFNLSKLHNLPVVYVIENNQYGMGTATSRSSACVDYYKRGCYIPGMRLDGMDVLAVREAARFCRDYVVKNGPIIMELITYRSV